jgi:conjugative relaxase-like TrwC/TraI family protein
VINVTALHSAAGAAGYLIQDNYYLESGQASSAYYGQGSDSLGLSNQAVTNEQLTHLLKGKLPVGEQVGREGEHRPGWDVTFSAPKSVSLQGLVGKDDRIIQAHDDAVKTALDHYEQHLVTRIRTNGTVEKEITGSLVAATFRHDTSRKLDPQLHTHALVLNVTQSADGQWRSVSSESLYKLQRELDSIYKTELESRLNQLGYTTKRDEKGNFEITAVPEAVRDAFSNRSVQVEAELAKQGLNRATSTAEQRDTATLKTRKAKPTHQDRAALQEKWQSQAKEMGWTPSIPAAEQSHQNEQNRSELTERVSHTIAMLSEKDAVVCEHSIYRQLNSDQHQAAISKAQLAETMKQLKQSDQIESRQLTSYDRHTKTLMTKSAITTKEAKQTEQKMLATAKAMNTPDKPTWIGKVSAKLETLAVNSGYFKGHAITSEKSAARAVDVRIALDASNGKHWTNEQRTAVVGILSHQGKLTQLQGYAGTAKTSSVLKSVRDIAKQQGYTVIAVAPSHSAANQLQRDIKADAQLTTSGYLAAMNQISQGKADPNNATHQALQHGKVIVIHDEAGLASSQQMQSFLDNAHQAGHRVLNSGDRYQKASIGAGSAFGQLTDAGVKTFELTTIFRQKDESLKQTVQHTLPSEPKIQQAMTLLERNGQITELKGRNERIQSIAQTYANLSKEQQSKTLVLDPTRQGVKDLNHAIRHQLQQTGQLPTQEISIKTLVARDVSKIELEQGAVGSVYNIGDTVTINSQALKQSYKLSKSDQFTVSKLHTSTNELTLQKNGKAVTISASELAKSHPTISDIETRQISIGDQVRFTSTDLKAGYVTNQSARVSQISNNSITLTNTTTGKDITLSTNKPIHINHDYAKTTFSSQGLTAENVIYHAQSTSTNLMNQRDFYVATSRATDSITIVTDNQRELTDLVKQSSGEKETALTSSKDTSQSPESIKDRDTSQGNERD